MFFDARISIGMLFTLMGTILSAYGLATRGQVEIYARSLGINANLWWGAVLLVFGVVILTLGRRGQARLEKAGNRDQGSGIRKTAPKKTLHR